MSTKGTVGDRSNCSDYDLTEQKMVRPIDLSFSITKINTNMQTDQYLMSIGFITPVSMHRIYCSRLNICRTLLTWLPTHVQVLQTSSSLGPLMHKTITQPTSNEDQKCDDDESSQLSIYFAILSKDVCDPNTHQ